MKCQNQPRIPLHIVLYEYCSPHYSNIPGSSQNSSRDGQPSLITVIIADEVNENKFSVRIFIIH